MIWPLCRSFDRFNRRQEPSLDFFNNLLRNYLKKFRCHLQKSLKAALPKFVIGFDLVGQEDLGRPLVDFADLLLDHKIPYFFHAGETNWQGQPTDTNLADAILLLAKRIGKNYFVCNLLSKTIPTFNYMFVLKGYHKK